MLCPKCHIPNQQDSNYCHFCGASLRGRPSNRGRWIFFSVCLMLLISGIFVYYKKARAPESRQKAVLRNTFAAHDKKTLAHPEQNHPEKIFDGNARTVKEKKLVAGLIIIKDISGKPILKMPAPVVDNGWIAAPKQWCTGGYEWTFLLDNNELFIEEGILSSRDDIGLWLIKDKKIDSLDLCQWDLSRPLKWFSIESGKSVGPFMVKEYQPQELFAGFFLPEGFNEHGVFIQDKKVVGWTFGELTNKGFLWVGDPEKDLRWKVTVDDFYQTTFAYGREEQFVRAIGMIDEYPDDECLYAFSEGLRLYPKLSDQDTPLHLRLDSIIIRMRQLITRLDQNESAEKIVDILDEQILMEAGDVLLLYDVVQATIDAYGYESGVRLAENVGAEIKQLNENKSVLLDRLLAGLYCKWITSLSANGYIQDGWTVFRQGMVSFPDDFELRLSGVKLALAENNWRRAQKLLHAKKYPQALKGRVEILEKLISKLKKTEGKIAIYFKPGSPQVSLTATLNGSYRQKFIVDTGASTVTIPYSALKELDISFNDDNPVRRIITAGGVKYAREIVISSIELEGFEVYDVKAFVLDLPDNINSGLLGLNYLGRFNMDLNNEEGLLLLEPR